MGKITVKHYLNKKLKPEKDGNDLYYPLYVSISVNRKFIKKRSGSGQTITENDFENGLGNLPDVKRQIEYENNLLNRIVNLFINDIENKTVKKELIYFFSSKGYNSKDDFINMLNAYIDYYSFSIYDAVAQYCTDQIEKEVFNKLAKVFNLSDKEDVKQIFKYKSPLLEAEFIYNNLSKQSIEFLILRERLLSYLSPYNIRTGYDIPLIDWLDGLIQNDLKEFLSTYKRNPEYYLKNGFVIDNELIEKYIKIIDDVIHSDDYPELNKSFWDFKIEF